MQTHLQLIVHETKRFCIERVHTVQFASLVRVCEGLQWFQVTIPLATLGQHRLLREKLLLACDGSNAMHTDAGALSCVSHGYISKGCFALVSIAILV